MSPETQRAVAHASASGVRLPGPATRIAIEHEDQLRGELPCRTVAGRNLAAVGAFMLGAFTAVVGVMWIAGFSVDGLLKLVGVR